MTSKAQSLRNKRAQAATKLVQDDYVPSPRGHTSTPTSERLARGKWAKPNIEQGEQGAYIDLACDMIGRLMVTKQITRDQEEAARMFQNLYSVYLSEIGIAGIASCLNTSEGGHDAGDGNPAVYAAYYKMREKIGRVKTSMLQNECFKDAEAMPYDLAALRNALNCLGS
jgi:hypothetical protein